MEAINDILELDLPVNFFENFMVREKLEDESFILHNSERGHG